LINACWDSYVFSGKSLWLQLSSMPILFMDFQTNIRLFDGISMSRIKLRSNVKANWHIASKSRIPLRGSRDFS